ncbi:MAG: hypothetical protein GY725_01650 [bacterium]|nr:hypothetical protein [bacterium]
MFRGIRGLLGVPGRYYFWGSAAIWFVAVFVISAQIADRQGFANADLHQDVLDRWGAPVVQPAPSVRYVESGSVFNSLESLPLDRQHVKLDAAMNYRKRGLVYFSGFEFDFNGAYTVTNPEAHPIDLVFVFPVQVARQSMLSDLQFFVNSAPAELPLADKVDKLTWTGRLDPGASVSFEIRFRGRGLEAFTYVVDPELPVRDLALEIDIAGGKNYDYGPGVFPATSSKATDEGVKLRWDFLSLEGGFPFGVIVPSERSFDSIMFTMIRRSWSTWLLFFAGLIMLATLLERPLQRYEAYLASAGYAFFYVLLPYLAAYMHFYAAYALCCGIIGVLLVGYLSSALSREARPQLIALVVSLLVVPTLAVILRRYTGLIYALEILAGIALLMVMTTRPGFRAALARLEQDLNAKENAHV